MSATSSTDLKEMQIKDNIKSVSEIEISSLYKNKK